MVYLGATTNLAELGSRRTLEGSSLLWIGLPVTVLGAFQASYIIIL